MKSILMLLFLALTACSTTSTRYDLTDPQGRAESRVVLDKRDCSKYSYMFHGNNTVKILDQEFYYACMQEKGYGFQAVTK